MNLVLAILLTLTTLNRVDLAFPPSGVTITQLNERRDALIQWTQNSKAIYVTIFAHRAYIEKDVQADGFTYFVTMVRTGAPGSYLYVEEQSMLPYYDMYYFYEYFYAGETADQYGPFIAGRYLSVRTFVPLVHKE